MESLSVPETVDRASAVLREECGVPVMAAGLARPESESRGRGGVSTAEEGSGVRASCAAAWEYNDVIDDPEVKQLRS